MGGISVTINAGQSRGPRIEGVEQLEQDNPEGEYASEAQMNLRVPGTNRVLSVQLGGSFGAPAPWHLNPGRPRLPN